ncbi:hypothetical protein ACFV84_35080 [Kitasatospora sp. NPDC059811]|uniref:hypothetical protein n=1 Tax=Streptomycetaceae TaxID=2062 RepID=UPI0007AFCB57|nr:hypothetical protein [Streptomyces sp. MJM8645]
MPYTPDTDYLLPAIITICGSTGFWQHMVEAALQETAAGRMVLAPGVDVRRQHPLWDTPAVAEELKTRLDALHLAKIYAADEVLVVTDENFYLGESTRREIAFAEALETPVSYWAAGRGRIGESCIRPSRAGAQWKAAFDQLAQATPTGPAREDLLALAAADLAVAEYGSGASLVDVRRIARARFGVEVSYDRAEAALATRTEGASATVFLLGDA